MFDGSVYASYIALCREREFGMGRVVRMGDWYVDANDEPRRIGWHPERLAFVEGVPAWLPRLDQWLTMLEEAGITGVSFTPTATPGEIRCFGQRWPQPNVVTAAAPTREEAAARLWMAVTGYLPPGAADR